MYVQWRAIKGSGILDLECIMLNAISHIKKNTMWFHLYMESKKEEKWTNVKKTKQTNNKKEHRSDE